MEHRTPVKRFVSLQFLNLRDSIGLLGRVISPSQGHYLTQTRNKHKETSMPRVWFESTIPASKRGKTGLASDRAGTVISTLHITIFYFRYQLPRLELVSTLIQRSLSIPNKNEPDRFNFSILVRVRDCLLRRSIQSGSRAYLTYLIGIQSTLPTGGAAVSSGRPLTSNYWPG
jgi:hypothetical protein